MLNNAHIMDQTPPPAQPAIGVASSSATQIAYTACPYQQPPMAASPSSLSPSSSQLTLQQAHQVHLQQQQQQNQQLQTFWAERILEIEQTTDFKNHTLPLARIKKIMKANEDVHMISAGAPVVFAKACEIFILELTLRSWFNTEENKRRTLQKNDIAAAISRTEMFDFLVDIVPRDELKEVGLGIPRAGLPMVGGPADSVPYYYVPQQNHVGAHDIYTAHQPQPGPYMPWPQVQPSQQQIPDNS